MVTENVYDGRFGIVPQLRAMGAEIEVSGHHAIVRGPRRLRGTTVRATDLRAGAALVIAGLVARGTTVITEPHHIDRGYAHFAARLRSLGADVERLVTRPLAV
jgi:UDP-N-acetylglucosamine 1-carboxyvinyltransferase